MSNDHEVSMLLILDWCGQTWWTETNATWIEALSLIPIFTLQLILAFFTLREQKEARRERRLSEIARQRSEVTCGGVCSILRTFSEKELCTNLWALNFRHGGFAFEKGLYAQLPEFLRRKCDPFMQEIANPILPEQHQVVRFLLMFRFPYPDFDAILEDINRLNFGNTHIVWDDNGNPIKVRRD
jgi:hypothetical protein